MLYYWSHLIYVVISSWLFKSKKEIDETITRTSRVSILDCEGFRYMSNSRYSYYMDFIRYELLFRTKLYSATVKKGMFPVLASQKLIYKKPLKRWNKFNVTLDLLGSDDNWAYHRHVFHRKGEVYAIGYTKLTFLKGRKPYDMNLLIKACGYTGTPTIPSKNVLNLFDHDYQLLSEASA